MDLIAAWKKAFKKVGGKIRSETDFRKHAVDIQQIDDSGEQGKISTYITSIHTNHHADHLTVFQMLDHINLNSKLSWLYEKLYLEYCDVMARKRQLSPSSEALKELCDDTAEKFLPMEDDN